MEELDRLEFRIPIVCLPALELMKEHRHRVKCLRVHEEGMSANGPGLVDLAADKCLNLGAAALGDRPCQAIAVFVARYSRVMNAVACEDVFVSPQTLLECAGPSLMRSDVKNHAHGEEGPVFIVRPWF